MSALDHQPPPFRVGVLGARRARQGIGEYVARELHRAGARVVAVAGTSEAGAAEAARALEARYGIAGARPYAGALALVRGEAGRGGLDAIAVCTPNERHEEALEAALEAGISVLCDKPLIWDPARPDGGRGRALIEGFAARGLHLSLLTQWPETLPAFRALYPEAQAYDASRTTPRTFAQRLCPLGPGAAGVVDCLPHAISLARALAGPGTAQPIAWRRAGPEGSVLEWRWRHARGDLLCELSMRRKETQPRPASYAIDGRAAAREIRLPAYAMELVGAGGRVPLEDPLALSVRRFVRALASSAPSDPAGLLCEHEAFRELADFVR